MVYKESTVTGYNYIDSEIDKIKDKLSEEEQILLEKLCGRIHSAGFDEGYYLKEEDKKFTNS